MPGFGSGTGKPSELSFFSNALQAYNHIIKNHQLNEENVFIMSRSLGASVATYVASKRNSKGLILITPCDSMEDIDSNHYTWFPVNLLLKHKFKTDEYIDNISSPILVIATDKDGVIPTINLNHLYEPRKDKINLLKINHANHNNINATEKYFSYINGFILSITPLNN